MKTVRSIQYRTMDDTLDLFERRAVSSPDSIALRCADQQMTYRELDQRANQLAWHLQN